MRVVAWNVMHRAMPKNFDERSKSRKVSTGFVQALAAFVADVVVLNEYVEHPKDDRIREVLVDLGYSSILAPARIRTNNQVLVAARQTISQRDLAGPITDDEGGNANFLHVHCGSVQLVGLRVPIYKGRVRTRYWSDLASIIRSAGDRPIIFVGDLNANPDIESPHPGHRTLRTLESDGWQVPRAEGQYSYRTGARLDHAVAARALTVRSARYVIEHEGQVLCGGKGAVSDHAPLLLEIQHSSIAVN